MLTNKTESKDEHIYILHKQVLDNSLEEGEGNLALEMTIM